MNDSSGDHNRDHATDRARHTETQRQAADPAPGAETILGRCLMDSDAAAMTMERRRRRKTFGVSLGLETVAVGVLIAAPLLTSVAGPRLVQTTSAAPIFSSGWRTHTQRRPATSVPASPSPRPGIRYFVESMRNPNAPSPTPVIDDSGTDPGPGMSFADFDGPIQVIDLSRQPIVIERPQVERPQPEKRPMKVSAGVIEGQIISRIEPRYPPLAVQIHLEGAVRLHAIIDREGRITALDVISGHPLLVQSAIDAVRQWRYRPTMLNGEPVEVDTSITVIFRLGGR